MPQRSGGASNKDVFGLPAVPDGMHVAWMPMGVSPPVDPQAEARRLAEMGDGLRRQGQLAQALGAYQNAVRLRPTDPTYHLRAATVAWELRQKAVVEHHMGEARRLATDARTQNLLAEWYYERGMPEPALAHSARAVEMTPDDAAILIVRAWMLEDTGDVEGAWRIIEPLAEANVPSAQLWVLYGRLAPRFGREGHALPLMERVLGLPEAQLPAPARAQVHLAAAALLDRAGEYDRAFEQMRLGKEVSRRPYDRRALTAWINEQIAYFAPRRLHSLPRASHNSRRPIFIIGVPRSGTSLVEQILASHPQVHGGGELQTLWSMKLGMPGMDWARGEEYPACLDGMGIRQANQLAAAYLNALPVANDAAAYVTDKLPTNFMLLGLIATLFPECHVIHCTRDPLDTCLSCYMTSFAGGHEFTHDLADLGTFYRDYHRWMIHWKTALHYPVIEVNYEELVADPEGQTRRLLDLVGLPWDERCLRFHQNKRIVLTASRYQVRQPIYDASVGRWKRYEKHLGELIAALGPAANMARRGGQGPSTG